MQENENEVTTNRIRIIILIILFFSLITCAYSQSKIAGYWKGTMMRDGSSMDVSFDFKMQNNSLLGFFNSPSQKASGIPLNNLQNTNDSLSFSLMSEPVTIFNCKISGDKINGEIEKGIQTKFKYIDYKSYRQNGELKDIYFKISDRKKAIEFAVSIANKGDLIVSTGKGHEQSINYGEGESPWSENKIAMEAIKKYAKK